MFKFLKEKLKSAISKISEGVEKEGKTEEKEVEAAKEIEPQRVEAKYKYGEAQKAEQKEEKGFFAKIKEKFVGKEERQASEEKKEEAKVVIEPKKEPAKKKREEEKIEKGFFGTIKEKIITTKISEGQFEKLFWELELAMMENNVAVEVIEKIKNDLKKELVEKPIIRTKVKDVITSTLKNSIEGLFQNNDIDLIQEIKNKKEKPYVAAFFGINGSGKTTSIAKLANMLKDKNISCVVSASDTFRAASIEQLQQHADKLGIKLIKHTYGSDPAAVAFDAINHAQAKNIDVVLIDTAGRMHSNVNLIDEMKKIIRVAKPDLKIFVGESITGNDCVEQAKVFNASVGIDGIILAKADIDEKGGAAVSVSYATKKPILYLGVGQNYDDLKKFEPDMVLRNLGLD